MTWKGNEKHWFSFSALLHFTRVQGEHLSCKSDGEQEKIVTRERKDPKCFCDKDRTELLIPKEMSYVKEEEDIRSSLTIF